MRTVSTSLVLAITLFVGLTAPAQSVAQSGATLVIDTAIPGDRALTASSAQGEDWPMWRRSVDRASSSPVSLPPDLQLSWWRQAPAVRPAWPEDSRINFDAALEPIVIGKLMFLASNHTESVKAYSTVDGREVWTFYTDGPVRFAPVGHGGDLYFGSDDGWVYCLSQASGELKWKFNAAPSGRKIVGNDHLISVWPVRGSPVVHENRVFFTAGVWSFEGTFLYCLDAKTGHRFRSSKARVDSVYSAGLVTLGDVPPQGNLVISNQKLIIPCGRPHPVAFDLDTGLPVGLKYATGKPSKSGYHVSTAGDWVFQGLQCFKIGSPKPLLLKTYRPVSEGSTVFYTTVLKKGRKRVIAAMDMSKPRISIVKDRKGQDTKRETYVPLWTFLVGSIRKGMTAKQKALFKAGRAQVHFKAEQVLYGRWGNAIYALSPPAQDQPAQLIWVKVLPKAVNSMITGDGKLFVSTVEDKIYCYSAGAKDVVTHPLPERSFSPVKPGASLDVKLALEGIKDQGGYCVILGLADGQLIDGLLQESDLRIVAITRDPALAQSLKAKYDRHHLYGDRVVVHQGDPTHSGLPPYLATMVVTETPDQVDSGFVKSVYSILRPYGGRFCLPFVEKTHRLINDMADKDLLSRATFDRRDELSILVRAGALKDSDDWSHEYGGAANTLASKDKLVKAPLGLLWFGGPSSMGDLYFDRHDWGPSTAVVEGRMYIQGIGKFTAIDVYTGRILWQIKLGRGTLTKERQGWSRGRRANWRAAGYHFVVDKSAVYLTYNEKCLVLDVATGGQVAELQLPDQNSQWGRIRIWDDYLVVPVYQPDRKMPTRLSVISRATHRVLWSKETERGFPLMAVGGGRVFAYEGHLNDLFENQARKGRAPKTDGAGRLWAIDLHTGEDIWDRETPQVVTWISFSEEYDALVTSDIHGIVVSNASNGKALWEKTSKGKGFAGHPENLWDKVIVWNDRIIDQRGPGKSYDLLSGAPSKVSHPITGASVQWSFTKTGHHCNYAVASEHLITFRAANAGYCDVETGLTSRLGGFRTGCRNSLIPANGVLNAPNFAFGCECSYHIFTSLALVHNPDAERWSYSDYRPSAGPVKHVGVNFGAPGDRVAPSGTYWGDYSSKKKPNPLTRLQGPSLKYGVTVTGTCQWFYEHASTIEGEELTWVASSGVKGVETIRLPLRTKGEGRFYTLRLVFAESEFAKSGERVFDVGLGEKTLLKDFDIFKEAGQGSKVVVKEFTRLKATEAFALTFTASKGVPLICGVEVLEESEGR